MSGNGGGYGRQQGFGGGMGQDWASSKAGLGSGQYGMDNWRPRPGNGFAGPGYGGQRPGMGGYGQNEGNPGYSLTGGLQPGMGNPGETGNPAPWRGDEGYNPGDYGYQPPQQQPGMGGIMPPPGGFGVPQPDGLQPFAPGTGGLRGSQKMYPNWGPWNSTPAPQGPIDGYGQGLTLEQMRGGYGGR